MRSASFQTLCNKDAAICKFDSTREFHGTQEWAPGLELSFYSCLLHLDFYVGDTLIYPSAVLAWCELPLLQVILWPVRALYHLMGHQAMSQLDSRFNFGKLLTSLPASWESSFTTLRSR